MSDDDRPVSVVFQRGLGTTVNCIISEYCVDFFREGVIDFSLFPAVNVCFAIGYVGGTNACPKQLAHWIDYNRLLTLLRGRGDVFGLLSRNVN